MRPGRPNTQVNDAALEQLFSHEILRWEVANFAKLFLQDLSNQFQFMFATQTK